MFPNRRRIGGAFMNKDDRQRTIESIVKVLERLNDEMLDAVFLLVHQIK